MTPAALVLRRAEVGLVAHLEHLLEEQPVRWAEVAALAAGLAAIRAATVPAHGALLTTQQMAEALGVSSKTILRRKKRGEMTPALKLGAGDRPRVRWAAP